MTHSPPRLIGLQALVTGGTRGIGAAIARRLMDDGASVTVTGTRADASVIDGAAYRKADFREATDVDNLCEWAAGAELDILINNAGINKIAPFASIDPVDFARIQAVNVTAPFRLAQSVLPHMRARGWGRIVAISSIWGHISKAERASYSASKFAIDGMTAALAAEVAQDGILANCVAPGFINTELTRRILGPDKMEEIAAQVPCRRLGQPEDVASLVAWLVSRENAYVSGQNILIDGGFTRT